jgi:hypothetical protein
LSSTWPLRESVYQPVHLAEVPHAARAALLDNYRTGHEFADLRLIVDPAGEVVPFRTVSNGDRFALRIDENTDGNPSARLVSCPWQSWASAWNRLTAHPPDTSHDKYDMTLNANLRRTQSWSVAPQYIKDCAEWRPD